MAVDTAKLVTLTPLFDHGETMVSPRPEPISNKIRDKAAATMAPAKTALQETALQVTAGADASSRTAVSSPARSVISKIVMVNLPIDI
jgi:hypothetical protein